MCSTTFVKQILAVSVKTIQQHLIGNRHRVCISEVLKMLSTIVQFGVISVFSPF